MFGQGSQNGAGMTFGNYWQQLTSAFKCLLICSLTFGILGVFAPFISMTLGNIIYETVNGLQIWRLFTSFLVDSSIINVLINLYILSTFMPELEKRYSTAFILAEIVIQNFYCNMASVIIGEILNMLGLVDDRTFSSFGLTNLMLIFLWQRVAINPEELTRFCCLPCIMPVKYLPWCFLLILTLQGGSGALFGCLLGHYQYMFLGLTPNPQKWYYSKIQSWLPHVVKGKQGFVSIQSISNSSISPSQSNSFSNPNELMNDGVIIGGSTLQQNTDYRHHWVQQEEQEQANNGDTQSQVNVNETNNVSITLLNNNLI